MAYTSFSDRDATDTAPNQDPTMATATATFAHPIRFDDHDTCGCPWLVLKPCGEMVAGFETEAEAFRFSYELAVEAADAALALAEEAASAAEAEREELVAALTDRIEEMGLDGLRALAKRMGI